MSAQPSARPDSFFSADLAQRDPEIAAVIGRELGRQQEQIELLKTMLQDRR